MNTYETKCKDNGPVSTILNIVNFFKSHGFTLQEQDEKKSEGNTYSVGLMLKYKDQLILKSYGKGATPDFARASGYAEMYERYATRLGMFFNIGFCPEYLDIHHAEKGYYIDHNEHLMTQDDILNESELVKSYFVNIVGEKNVPTLIKLLTDGKPIGVPYYNLVNNSIKYYDPRLLYRLTTSNGLAAGNTYEEACVQALSEVYERYAEFFTFANLDQSFAELDLTTLKNPALRYMLNGIEATHNHVRIFDLSYTSHTPTLLIAVFNEMNSRIYLNFGSAPEFDIALERIITELYQGLDTLNVYDHEIQEPAKLNAESLILKQGGNSAASIRQFSEEIFLNTKKVSCYESPYFLYGNSHSNTELLEWLKQIALNLDFHVYIHDYSMCKDVYAVHVFVDNVNVLPQKELLYKTYSSIIKNKDVNLLQCYLEITNSIKNDNYEAFKANWTKVVNYVSTYSGDIACNIMMSDWAIPFYFNIGYAPSFFWSPDLLLNSLGDLHDEEFYKKIKLCKTLGTYRGAGYSDERIEQIFSYFDVDVTKELSLLNSADDIIKYAFFETLKNRYKMALEIFPAMLSDL